MKIAHSVPKILPLNKISASDISSELLFLVEVVSPYYVIAVYMAKTGSSPFWIYSKNNIFSLSKR